MLFNNRGLATPAAPRSPQWSLPLLVGIQTVLGFLTFEHHANLADGFRDMLAIPYLLGVLLLSSNQVLVLAVTSGAWFAAIAVHCLPAGGMGGVDVIGWIGVRIIAILISLSYAHQRERLHSLNRLLDATFESPLMAKAVTRRSDGSIAKLNTAMARLLGEPGHQLVGRHWREFCKDSAPGANGVQALQTALGQRYAEIDTADLLHTHDEDLRLIRALDVEERIQNQQRLARQQTQLRQALRASLRSSALIHELRQPLTVLLLQIRNLQVQHATDDSSLMDHLDLVQHSATDIKTTIDGIESLLSSANRRDPQVIDLSSLVVDAVAQLQNQLSIHDIELDDQQLVSGMELKGDRRQLQFATGNLLRNAIEALIEQPTGPRRLMVSLQRQGGHAVMQIADNGPGLASLDLNELQFQSNKPGGLGLGLFIVELVATNHEGSLQLGRSLDLGGAELTLKLALCAAA